MRKAMVRIGAAVAAAVIAAKTARAASARSGIDDARVAPPTPTSRARGDAGGRNRCNHCAPNRYVCGCAAAAIAQDGGLA